MKQDFEVGVYRLMPSETHGLYERYILATRAYFDLPNEGNWDAKEEAFERYSNTVRRIGEEGQAASNSESS